MRWLVAAALVALVSPAGADTDEPLAPRRVTATVRDTHVVLEVRVRVPLDPTYFPAATVHVAIPVGAVVTHGRAFVDGVERALPLMDVEHASAAFFGIGSAAPEGPRAFAVHVTALTNQVEVEVATPRGGALDVALEVDASTCFSRDRRWVQLPPTWRGAIAGAVETAPPGCTAVDDGPWLGLRVPAPRQMGVIGGRLALPSRDFAKVEVDLGRELASVPEDLATVIVVDASRSVSDAQREAQRAIVASYLAHVPHSMVQVIAVARRARPVLPSWVASSVAAARIDHELRMIAGANGSNVDAAIAEAGAWLGRIPGTHRVIVLTDELVPNRLYSADAAVWAKALPPGTVVHVVGLRDSGELARDDEVLYGALAKATGGIGVEGGNASDATMLVRPISVDQIAIEGAGWDDEGVDACPERLDAGTSCTWFGHASAPTAGAITVTGLVWNTKLMRTVVPERGRGLAIARELSASERFEMPVQLEIDRAALAVNLVWSLFGSWGGRGGYANQLGFGTSGTMSGRSVGTIVDRFGTANAVAGVDLLPQFHDALLACGPGTHGNVTVWLTREEITDVEVTHAGDDQSCIEEAIWNTLVRVPEAQPHARATFTL